MKLELKVEDGMITEIVPEGDVQLSLDGAIAFCMSFMESACKNYIDNNPDIGNSLYDIIDSLFYQFMIRTFPDIQPREFDLSDAGLLYAQDMIIDAAAKKGITYKEALEEYEAKAKQYVKKKARIMA